MADYQYWSWKTQSPFLVGEVLRDLRNVSWAIAPTRQLEALFKQSKEIPFNSSLSVQEVIDLMPRRNLKADHSLEDLSEVAEVLTKTGTVLNDKNPLTWKIDPQEKTVADDAVERFKAKGGITIYDVERAFPRSAFEEQLMRCLLISPVAAQMKVARRCENLMAGKEVYSTKKPVGTRTVLITGYGIDRLYNEFWEAQEFQGTDLGDAGFIRILRNSGMITLFFDISVSEQKTKDGETKDGDGETKDGETKDGDGETKDGDGETKDGRVI